MPRVISATIRHALAERNGKGLSDLKRRIQKIVARGSNDEFIRLLSVLRDSLEGRPGPAAAEPRQPIRTQFILESTGEDIVNKRAPEEPAVFEVAGERMQAIDPDDGE